MSKIKVSDTIGFDELRRAPSRAAQPFLELEVAGMPFKASETVPIEGRFSWPGPMDTELVEFMVRVSGERVVEGVPHTFSQAAEAAHKMTVHEHEVITIPVSWHVPFSALPGTWRVSAQVVLEGGVVLRAQTEFAVDG